MNDRKCCICSKKYPERWMMSVFTGRTHWICWECYKLGDGQAAGFEIKNRAKKEKEWNK